MGGHLLAPPGRELLQHVLGHGQHAAGPAGTVVEQIGGGLDLVGYGQEDQLRHELHGVARGEVLAGLLVVLLVEAPDQLLEDRAHAVVVERGMPDRAVGVDHRSRTQVDVGRGELFDQGTQGVGLGEARDLVAELEVLEDVLDSRREAVEVVLEVGSELLAAGAGTEVVEGELRGVVERLAGRLTERFLLLDDPLLVEPGLHVEDGPLGGFEDGVEAAQNGHGEDDVAVLAADVDVAEDIVGDAPDVVGDPVEVGGGHGVGGGVVVGVVPVVAERQYCDMWPRARPRRASPAVTADSGLTDFRWLVRFVRHIWPKVADKLAARRCLPAKGLLVRHPRRLSTQPGSLSPMWSRTLTL